MYMIKTFSKMGALSSENRDYLNYYELDDMTILAMADGASCSKNCNKAMPVIIESLMEMINKNRNWENIDLLRIQVVNMIKQKLTDIAIREDVERKSLGSTLMMLCMIHDKYLAIHIGDGMIIRNSDIISYPHNGIDKYYTFLTTGEIEKTMRMKVGKRMEIDKFALLSDGFYRPLLKMKNICDIINETTDGVEEYVTNTCFTDDASIIIYE